MPPIVLEARVKNLIQTEAEWLAEDPIILDGEVAYVRFGNFVNTKAGDGIKKFSQLQFNLEKPAQPVGILKPTDNPGPANSPRFWFAERASYPNLGLEVTGALGIILDNGVTYGVANFDMELSSYAKDEDLKVIRPFFPFTNELADKVWYNVFKDFIVDAVFKFEKAENLYYSFAGILKNEAEIRLTLYSSPNPGGGNWVNLGSFYASKADGYNHLSLEPFVLKSDLGTVIIVPGAITDRNVNGLGYLSLGFDDTVWDIANKNHVYFKAEQTKQLIDLNSPMFPFWPDVDTFWYQRFKAFLIDVNLTFDRDKTLYYSFAIIQKTETIISLFLYSSTNKSGADAIQLGAFSSNLNLGYISDSFEPFLIENPALGSVVIVPAAIPTTNQTGLFYALNGLSDDVFSTNAKQNSFVRYTKTKKGLIRTPNLDWSNILDKMFYRGKVVVEFIGDSITVGQEGLGTTFPDIFHQTIIKMYHHFSALSSGSPIDITILNKAVGGTSTSDGRIVISQNLGGANVCHIMYGYNDAPYYGPNHLSIAVYKENLEFIVRTAIEQGKVPILGIQPNLSNAFQTGLFTGYRSANIEIAKKYNLIYIDYGKQVWDIITRPDGLHFDNFTYFAMGFDLAGYFTTMNYFNNIEIHKGDRIFVTDAMQNVTGDSIMVDNENSTKGKCFMIQPGETLGFAFRVQDNCQVYCRVINDNDGAGSGKFTFKTYKSLKNPLPEITPNGTSQTINFYTIKAGNRAFLFENTDTSKPLFIDYIGFE